LERQQEQGPQDAAAVLEQLVLPLDEAITLGKDKDGKAA
jgi:hypothetical protein